MRVETVARQNQVTVQWRPFDVRAIMTEMNNFPFHTKPAKLRYMWRDVERRAGTYGIAWSAVPPYPLKHLSLVNRIALFGTKSGWCEDYVRAAYRMWFVSGQDPTLEENVRENLHEIGQDPDDILALASSDNSKNALNMETATARALGIFGSPTFVTRGEMFWGDDRLEDAVRWQRQVNDPNSINI
jgi:2-hydroxychromene-2-carboxylate isomerase